MPTSAKNKNRSLKSVLLFRFLSLVAFAILMVTAWSIASGWIWASLAGQRWASAHTKHFKSEVSELGEEATLVQAVTEHALARGELPNLPHEYLLLSWPDGKRLKYLLGNPLTDESDEAAIRELSALRKKGVYEFKGNLVYAVPSRPKDRFLLLKPLGNSFADRLATAMNTEVSIYVTQPAERLAATSWEDIRGQRIFPPLPEDTWAAIRKLSGNESFEGTAIYNVPEYRGLYQQIEGHKTFHRGESRFRAFHAFTPILDANEKRIGFFSVIVPEDVLLYGVKQGAAFALLCGLLVLLFSTWMIYRTTKRIADPLAALSKEVHVLAVNLYSKTSKYGGDPTLPLPSYSRNEIDSLTDSIKLLKSEMGRSEKIAKLLDDERTRTQFASKMAALGEMSASIAHEINNPISVIHAVSDELQERALAGPVSPEETRRLALVIKDTATRVASIIHALLRLARDANDDPMDWCSLQAIVEDATVLVRDQLQKGQIWLSVVGLDTDVKIRCRSAQISQVILNLLNNSIDAVEHAAEKRIVVSVKTKDGIVEIAVTDSGEGVPENIREKVLEPFVTSKPPGKGTGLGLSISKHILEEHHGRIYLDQESKKTRFVLELPAGSDGLPIQSLDEAANARGVD